MGLFACNVPVFRDGGDPGHRFIEAAVEVTADDHGATGIAVYRMKNSDISDNLVHDTAYFGMCLAGDQDPKWNFMEGNTVERNHIHRAMQVTQDGAGLYVCFSHHGARNFVRANLIHDTNPNKASAGLYLDSACAGVTFDRNVIDRNPSMTVILNRKEDLIRNAWTGNLVLSASDEAPPVEFVEALKAYAGLEPAYRRTLQAIAPQRCDRLATEPASTNATWLADQFDMPNERRGVVQVMRAFDMRMVSEEAAKAGQAAKARKPVEIVPSAVHDGEEPPGKGAEGKKPPAYEGLQKALGWHPSGVTCSFPWSRPLAPQPTLDCPTRPPGAN